MGIFSQIWDDRIRRDYRINKTLNDQEHYEASLDSLEKECAMFWGSGRAEYVRADVMLTYFQWVRDDTPEIQEHVPLIPLVHA